MRSPRSDISLAPGFSPVSDGTGGLQAVSTAFPSPPKAAEAAEILCEFAFTGLKPGANERGIGAKPDPKSRFAGNGPPKISRPPAIFALLTFTACHLFAADTPKPVEVKTSRPTRGEIVRYVTLPGTIRANQQATLYAKVAGYLKSLTVDKGDRVQPGQALGEIEVPELLADLAKFKAEVKVADTDYQRVNAAQKKAPDLVTPQSVDEARGRLEIATANLERTETLLGYAKITAPFAGIVTARFVDPGAFIPAATSGSAAQTAAIVTVADFSVVRAQVALPEVEAALARVGQPVKLTVEGLAGKSFEANVSRLSYALDDATKTMLIEADLPNPDLALRPGMYATIKVGVEKHADALLIPVEGLVMEKVNAFTSVADGGKAKKTAIKTGFNDGVKVEVLSGLTGSEAIILVGKMTLADGAAVNVMEEGK